MKHDDLDIVKGSDDHDVSKGAKESITIMDMIKDSVMSLQEKVNYSMYSVSQSSQP